MIDSTSPAAVIVLAAGKGTRMKSRTSKLLHQIAGVSLLGHVVGTARALQPDHLAVVVGHGREQVVPHLADLDPDAQPVVQEVQGGTGHAVRTALEVLPALSGTVVVTYADAPLLSAETLRALIAARADAGAAVSVL
ncbi:MAG: NTP transferase domain-containing protein, partial [Micromonosporaceae bacterium]